MQRCRYYVQGEVKCALGIAYNSVTPNPGSPGAAFRLPCLERGTENEAAHRAAYGGKGECEHVILEEVLQTPSPAAGKNQGK